MDNSNAYKNIIQQMQASGRQKLEGYQQEWLNQVYEWERNAIEDLIWESFTKHHE